MGSSCGSRGRRTSARTRFPARYLGQPVLQPRFPVHLPSRREFRDSEGHDWELHSGSRCLDGGFSVSRCTASAVPRYLRRFRHHVGAVGPERTGHTKASTVTHPIPHDLHLIRDQRQETEPGASEGRGATAYAQGRWLDAVMITPSVEGAGDTAVVPPEGG